MGPPENRTRQIEKQEAHGRKRQVCRPRLRQCLLKGCERRFRPKHACQRYCSPQCRGAARTWSGWKARRVYRATAAGQQKRKRQSQRYRKRVKERKPPENEVVPEAARVISKNFFRWLLRPARLLRVLPALAALTAATVLFASVRWSASGNANDAGKGGMAGIAVLLAGGPARGSRESQEMSLPY
jgi:hypothetical protein